MVGKINTENYIYVSEEEEDYFDYFYDQPGSEPGTLNIDPDSQPSKIILIDYDQNNAIRKIDITPKGCLPYLEKNSVICNGGYYIE